MVRLPNVSAGKLKRTPPGLIIALSMLLSSRGFLIFNDSAPGALVDTEEVEYFAVCMGDTFGGKVLAYTLDSGSFGGVVDGIIGLLSAISGLLSGSAHIYSG